METTKATNKIRTMESDAVALIKAIIGPGYEDAVYVPYFGQYARLGDYDNNGNKIKGVK